MPEGDSSSISEYYHVTTTARLEEILRDGLCPDAKKNFNYDFNINSYLYNQENLSDILSQLIRTTFIPKKNHRFIIADFSAIEARIIAYLSDEKWR